MGLGNHIATASTSATTNTSTNSKETTPVQVGAYYNPILVGRTKKKKGKKFILDPHNSTNHKQQQNLFLFIYSITSQTFNFTRSSTTTIFTIK